MYLTWGLVYKYDNVLPNFSQNDKSYGQICTENKKTRFIFSISTRTPPRKQCRLWDNVETFGRAGEATDDGVCLLYPGDEATYTNSEYVNVLFIAYPL